MDEHVFASRHLDIMATAAVHRFYITVRNLFDIGVAVLAVDTCVRAPAEELFIHIKQAIIAFLVHAGKTPEAVAHQTFLCVRSGIFRRPSKAA